VPRAIIARGGDAAYHRRDKPPDRRAAADEAEAVLDAVPRVDDASGERAALLDLNAARVLILDVGYAPLHVVSVKRAVTMLMLGVADRVHDDPRVLRSPSRVMAVPSVIRLRRYVKRPLRRRLAFNRKNVFRRDDHTCQYCGTFGYDLTLDHVLPRSRGGPTRWENVVACCRRCNASKRDRTPEEANMRLARPPRAPSFTLFAATPAGEIDPAWRAYLPGG
jgi:5-methylcytosine-specific restriction endonuclease McrA